MTRPARILSLLAALTALLVLPLAATAKPYDPSATFTTTKNLHQLGFSAQFVAFGGTNFNSDLAFWGDYAYQGKYDGFRIVDVKAPGNPKEILNFNRCVQGTTTGNQGDVVVWDDILVRSWNSPAPAGGAFCGDLFTPEGQEGLHIFDISNPKQPKGLAFVPVEQGSHTATGVPDLANGRLLVYNSASSTLRPGIDIVEIPLDDPASASVIGFEPADRACHDTAVILGDVMRAACAGHDGFTVWSLGGEEGGSLDDPRFLYSRVVPGVSIGHSASFSWDGKILVFGHEPGGGVQARCQATSADVDKTLFFMDTATGAELGRFVLPRPQSATENCTIHNYNVVPTDKGHVLVHGSYQSGIGVVDFTDPTKPEEIAFADPAPLVPAQLGGDWSSYWYNGAIYESDITRGLLVWKLSDDAVAGAKTLSHLNPQTQETSFEVKGKGQKRPPEVVTTGSFELVGHDPLMGRGMNAALAIHGDYAYIGSRTDGKNMNENNAGVFIVDISDPTNPHIVNQMGPPLEGVTRESSRELRVWAEQEILIVLHTNCGTGATHWCSPSGAPGATPTPNNFKFYDISGEFATNPRLIGQLNQSTHEFFLWQDPYDPEYALMFGGSAGNNFAVWDLSPLLDEQLPVRIANSTTGYTRFPAFPAPVEKPSGGLHSLSVSNDGNRAYFALLTGGFAVVDTSDFASRLPSPQRRLVTLNENRPVWPGPGGHSAIKLWDRDWVYVSDEVYGSATASDHGCPWGWARMIDISDPTAPVVRSEYKVEQNYEIFCDVWDPHLGGPSSNTLRNRTSYSAHNPTHTPNIVFTSWHSNGLQAISVHDPLYPYQLAEFMPEPLSSVQLEDPRLSDNVDTGNGEKVVMWSYPIVKDGLIYVVDLRNGLYVLEYNGLYEDEVEEITFLEGNSNLGNALCYEPVPDPADPGEVLVPDYCGFVGGGGSSGGPGGVPGPPGTPDEHEPEH